MKLVTGHAFVFNGVTRHYTNYTEAAKMAKFCGVLESKIFDSQLWG